MEQPHNEYPPMSTLLHNHILSVLREEGLNDDIHLDIRRGSNKADHFMSITHKVTAYWETPEAEKKNLHLFVKSIPKNQAWKNTFKSEFIFKKEITFYDEIVPAFQNFQKQHWTPLKGDPIEVELDLFPKCYRAMCNGSDDFIIMEDLMDSGFKMLDRLQGLDLEKSLLTMRSLGRFHALSYAMKEKDPTSFNSLKALATESVFLDRNGIEFGTVFQKNAESALKEIKGRVPEAAVDKLCIWLQVGVYKQMTRLAHKKDELAVINHGDCWINNILFRSDESGNEELRFIDFQVIRYASPALDLSYFIFTSVRKDVREKYFDALLKEYHSTLVKWMARFGCVSYHNILSYKNLEERMSKFSLFGLVQALIFVPLYHTGSDEASEVASKEEILGDMMTFHVKEMKHDVVLDKLSSMVRQCYERGYL